MNSEFQHPVNFTAGVYYQDAKLGNRVDLFGNMALGMPQFLGRYEQQVDIETQSLFAQLRWDISEQVEIAAGVRWTDEERELRVWNWASGAPVPFPTSVPRIKSDNLSPELTVTYQPTDMLTLFGSLRKGYKSGSFNLTALSGGPNQDFSFEDEEVEGGELGLKSVLFGRQLAFNLAGYFFRYKDLQVGVVTPIAAGGVPVNRTLNAGSAESYGVELDFGFRPRAIVRLQIHGAVGWNHARFRRLNNVPCWGGQTVAEGCTEGLNPQTGRFTGQNLAGEPLVRAPDWQANIGFSYDIPLNQLWTLVVSNENQYSSKYKTVLGLRDDFWQKAFFKTDWSLALTDADARWEIAAIGKNLTNELTTGNCTPSNAAAGSVFGGQNTGGTTRGPSGVDELACFMDRGRELWLRLTYNFGKGAD